ncbi:MAG TPA: DUF433 domain-containing protein [Abditibacterium sp.]|jgi:uncharacterized protein (DUF433 family)
MPATLSRFIVSDPSICHGAPTFRGTRILVADVLEQIASGMAWESILEEWRGALSRESLAEAVQLAREGLATQREGFSQPIFPLRGTSGVMHEPFKPAVEDDEWDALS